MLSYMLDENLSPVVAEQLAAKRPGIAVESIHYWRTAELLGAPDESILRACAVWGYTLVTYDVQMLSDLAWFFESGEDFSGIVFVDERTVPYNNIGALVRALSHLWDHSCDENWSQRVVYLERPPV